MDEPFAARRWTSRSRRGDGRAVRGAAMDEPFANSPSWSGHMNWDPEEMTAVVAFALDRG